MSIERARGVYLEPGKAFHTAEFEGFVGSKFRAVRDQICTTSAWCTRPARQGGVKALFLGVIYSREQKMCKGHLPRVIYHQVH